ncbi:MAG: hypothetical protein E7637_03455 [Ruminococcaceae bacterium]|nr:hypothetical protein [Oscillospiraceae bacterium]
MKNWKVSVTCILLAFLCLASSLGYAAISDSMRVSGSVKTDVPYGLFITNVVTIGQTNTDSQSVSFLPYSTTLDSTINRSNRGAATVTYRITVLNNTSLTYSYRNIYYQTDLTGYNGNNYIATSPANSKIGVVCALASASSEDKKVAPGETMTFTVTYTVGTSRSANSDWKTLINFQFGINVDGEREALAVVEDKFLKILNTTSTYEQLIDALDNKFDGRQEWTSNYIGNVTGSSSEDSMAVNTLFAGQLQITVGTEQLDATVLIKHENLDQNNLTGDDYVATNSSNGGVFRGYGCEMTLYLTIDPLNRAGAYVPVYAVVFTCDRDESGNISGNWYRIGSMYAGTANVVTYDGGNGTGSFVTDNWIADAATYQLIDGYSFTIGSETYLLDTYSHVVAQGDSIKKIVVTQDATAITTLQTLLNHAKKITDSADYAGIGIELVQECYEKFSNLYTVDASGNHTVDADLTIAQLSPAILELYQVVNDALVKINELINAS